MPSITYNGQSFAIDGRRLWVLGASIHYARIPPELWPSRLAAAKQAGFNTIETACPWVVHESRKGRLVFDGQANLRQFVQLCGAAGLRVILRPGPFIGAGYDGGGLPGWLIEMKGIRLRENNPLFLENVSRYFRRLLGEVSDLQITSGGPIFMVQSEHAWTCSNDLLAEKYLNEITRFIRESGITVPVINANDLWQETPGTIDTWRGYDDLLVHLRQLRTVQPTAPRLVSAFDAAEVQTWGNVDASKRPYAEKGEGKTADDVLRHLAEILATGAQPIVSPFAGGTNFGFLGGRAPGRADGYVTTAGVSDPPLGQGGVRGRKYHAIRRLVTFANHFSNVFAELDPDYQPIVLDPEQRRGDSIRALSVAVVPQRGAQGRIVFVFGGERDSARRERDETGAPDATIVLDNGIRLPVHLGDQSVGWFALDVDLQGVGRLDYANVCPWAMVDRSIVVFQGPARAPAFISISGTPMEAIIPADDKPLVVEQKGITIVICNQQQIDATYHDETSVYVGIDGFDLKGHPRRDERFGKPLVIRKHAKIEPLDFAVHAGNPKSKSHPPPKAPPRPARPQTISLSNWLIAPLTAYIAGESPRFASLDGPETLSECGAPMGYGWYRLSVKATGRRLCHIPRGGDRLHFFVNGARQHVFGAGPGAENGPFELRLTRGEKGDVTIVAFVDNFGRFFDGNDLAQCKGLWGHVYEVKPLRSARPKTQTAKPVSPFSLRGFVSGRDAAVPSDSTQAVWTFAHPRRTPIMIDVNGARISGTFTINDKPIAYFAGATGGCGDRILLEADGENAALKRGKNVLRFAPDLHRENIAEEMAKFTTLYECVETLTESSGSSSGVWAFAKWEPPPNSAYDDFDKSNLRHLKGVPCWWRAKFDLEPLEDGAESLPFWLDMNGLSKGQAFINGENLGRYFTATGSGKLTGPQTRLFIPTPWIKFGQTNEVVLFDEHGFQPVRVKIATGLE